MVRNGSSIGCRCQLREYPSTLSGSQADVECSVIARSLPSVGPAVETTISIRVVQALVDAVERAGFPRNELLRAAGLEAAQLDAAEARVPRREVCRICEIVLDLTGDPAFGLHWSERLTDSAFVPISYLMAHAPSLGEGFASLSQFGPLLSDDPGFDLVEHDGKVTLRYRVLAGESLRMQRFAAEMVVASFYRIVRHTCAGSQPEQVSFEYAAPDYHQEYARVFDQAARFEQPFTGIVFDRALLNVTSTRGDAGVHEALRSLAERRMSRLTQHIPYALRVRELLVERGWSQRIDMKSAARVLGLSVRSLRRRLASEGKSYNDIEKHALAIVAQRLLRDEQRTIQETAHEMGFSDTTTFHRAFKRWTGTTPSAYQADSASGASAAASKKPNDA
jgi:AraC-like DNA-binding protein